jgi:predicted transcriptional regulator
LETIAMSTRVLTAHIPEELAEKVDVYAKSMERSRAWIVKQALSKWVDWEEQKHQMTLQGLADIEAGRVVDDEQVRAWIESLDTDAPMPVPQSGK